MELQSEYKVTHYYKRSPNTKGWIQTSFITRLVNKKEVSHYLEFENIMIKEQKIEADIKNGSLQKLPYEFFIYEHEGIWITPEQKIYIADSVNPAKGRKKEIFEDNIVLPYDAIEIIINNILQNRLEIGLEIYLSKMYWKMC